MSEPARAGLASPLATREEAAEYLRVSVKTFARRVDPELARVMIGARVMYRWEELDRWLDAQTVGPLRETGEPVSTSFAGATRVAAITDPRAAAIAARLRKSRRGSSSR